MALLICLASELPEDDVTWSPASWPDEAEVLAPWDSEPAATPVNRMRRLLPAFGESESTAAPVNRLRRFLSSSCSVHVSVSHTRAPE